jgi:signal transduction histidine kinase
VQKTLYIVNKVTIVIFFGAGFMSFLLISILVQKIIKPLKKIGETAKAISNLEFQTVEIHTNDELETLATNINHMSFNLQQAHQELEKKNKQMKELLSNVTHDLKTPVSLMKAYANGMKDGIDDGTFIDTIINQTDRMEQMIERLLCLSRVQQKEYHFQQIDISECLRELLQDYHLQEETNQIVLEAEIQDSLFVHSNFEMVNLIFSNLLSNAVKYSADKRIKINLCLEEGHCVFRIQNRVSDAQSIDTTRLWEPFYVAEQSRNQELSGTGLGLAIVRDASERLGCICECALDKRIITFSVTF